MRKFSYLVKDSNLPQGRKSPKYSAATWTGTVGSGLHLSRDSPRYAPRIQAGGVVGCAFPLP